MNRNQEAVLKWLKNNVEKSRFGVINELSNAVSYIDGEASNAYNLLSWKEELEVTKVLVEWELNKERPPC
ncbi:hypothetical protein [Carnobacterium mobile]|uniref:hypothetical protein n=1 Tax=Carnobacterium mobile TaxID=2750 RepID=UPI000555F363|nr:hypothetical protein [Carnobacterium mobile]